RRQQFVRAIFAKVQVRRAVEIADREVADALLPVEAQAALRVHSGQWADRRRNAQVLAPVFAFELGEIETLMACAAFSRHVEADQIRIVDAQFAARVGVRADFFERLHVGLPRFDGAYANVPTDETKARRSPARARRDPARDPGDSARPRRELR